MDSGPLSQKSAVRMQNRKTKTKTNTNNPSPDPNRYRRRCPDPSARIQKFRKDCILYSLYYPKDYPSIAITVRIVVTLKLVSHCRMAKL